jgi:hypothetical protein
MRFLTNPSISLSRARTVLIGLFASLLVSLSMAGAAGAASSVAIYKNKLDSVDKRAQVGKYRGKGSCIRSSSKSSIKFRIGKSTRECAYLVPVVGRDMEITATGRLFKSTPKAIKERTFLSVNVRHAKDGSRYQLAVYPSGRRWQIRKVRNGGKVEVLKGGKAGKVIGGFGEANRMVLRAYNGISGQPSGSARLVAIVNGKKLGFTDDPSGGELQGRDTTFSIASSKGAKGAFGSFTGLTVRMPNPFD